MKKTNISELLFHILLPLLIGSFVGLVFKDYTSYIETLERRIPVPPIIFPIVWSILYILIGLWYHFYQKDATGKNKLLYYVALAINFLFTPVLFYFENIVLAFIIVIVLIVLNIYLFVDSIKKSKKGYLLIPYLLWLFFAFILMCDLLINNVL